MDNRLTRALAAGAASAMLFGAGLLTATGASAAPSHHPVAKTRKAPPPSPRCHWHHGFWTKVWHRGWRDRFGHWHHGYWTRVWHPGFWVCPPRR